LARPAVAGEESITALSRPLLDVAGDLRKANDLARRTRFPFGNIDRFIEHLPKKGFIFRGQRSNDNVHLLLSISGVCAIQRLPHRVAVIKPPRLPHPKCRANRPAWFPMPRLAMPLLLLLRHEFFELFHACIELDAINLFEDLVMTAVADESFHIRDQFIPAIVFHKVIDNAGKL